VAENETNDDDITVPTQEVEIELRVKLTVKVATLTFANKDTELVPRTDLPGDIIMAVADAITHEMPYKEQDREPTDLIQEVVDVKIYRL
jgi:hypothetical protein